MNIWFNLRFLKLMSILPVLLGLLPKWYWLTINFDISVTQCLNFSGIKGSLKMGCHCLEGWFV